MLNEKLNLGECKLTKNKPAAKKRRLVKANRRSQAVPIWIFVKSGRKVRSSPKRRNWRRSKLRA